MRYYYIDSENVGAPAWCKYMSMLNGHDVVIIIRTIQSNAVDLRLIPSIVGCKCKIEVVDACTGTKNALDFVLVSELTKHAMSARKSAHVIVSSDKGYRPVVLRLKQQGIAVWQVSGISPAVVKKLKGDFGPGLFTDEEIQILKANGISCT